MAIHVEVNPITLEIDITQAGPQGVPGPQGQQGLTQRGAYDPDTLYVVDDWVTDGGQAWVALQPTQGNAPPVPPAESNAFWTLLAGFGEQAAEAAASAAEAKAAAVQAALVPNSVFPLGTAEAFEMLLDVDGRIGRQVGLDGRHFLAAATIGGVDAQPLLDNVGFAPLLSVEGVGDADLVMVDPNGRVVLAIGPSGVYSAAGGTLERAGGASNATPAYSWDPVTASALPADPNEIQMILINGQSWAEGLSSDPNFNQPLSVVPEHPGFAQMFSAGVSPDDAALTGFADVVARQQPNLPETIAPALANTLQRIFLARFGRDHPVLVAIASQGNQSYTNLKRGSLEYARLLRYVEGARDLAQAQGRRVAVPAVCFLHGETDDFAGVPRQVYRAWLRQLRGDLQADIEAILGRPNPLRLFAYTNDRAADNTPERGPSLGTLDAAREDGVHVVGPSFLVGLRGPLDPGHPTSRGYLRMGEYWAYAIAEQVYGAGWHQPEIVEAWWQSATVIRARFHVPEPPLVIDTSGERVKATGDLGGSGQDIGTTAGFLFDDGSGTAPSISSVSIVDATAGLVDVTLSGPSSGPRKRLSYALVRTGASSGDDGPRGLFRDSLVRLAQSGGVNADNAPLWNWCLPALLDL